MDRNLVSGSNRAVNVMSLSARRAWIEINNLLTSVVSSAVALRKESVDRNGYSGTYSPDRPVALRKESVDRNRFKVLLIPSSFGRSPQGERG